MLAKTRSILFLPALLLALAVPSLAQVGRLEGKVTGENGEPIGGAVIKIERTDVNGEYEVKTHKKKGTFLHAGLPLGTYTVSLLIDDQVIDRVAGVRVGMGSQKPVIFDLAEIKQRQQAAQQSNAQPNKQVLASMSPAERKKYEAELEKRQKAMAKNKELNETFNLGMEAKKAENFAAAIEHLTKATEIDPEQDVIWGNLADSQMGLAGQKTGDESTALYEAAIENYAKALAINPAVGAYYNNTGQALIALGRTDEGVAAFEQAAAVEPQNAGTYYFNLGVVSMNRGDADGAIEGFRRATEVDPTRADAYYYMASNMSGKATMADDGTVTPPDGMVEALNKYLELAPDGPNAPAAQGLLAAMTGQVETAFEDPAKGKKKK